MPERKAKVLETYKLIFRFSIGKLISFLENEQFLLILLQYLKDTQLERIHKRGVLCKNYGAYYRAIENMLNLSAKSQEVKRVIIKNQDGFKGYQVED